MKKADIHIHTLFSPDGKSAMEEYCNSAINHGIDAICFTDHVEFNDKEINLGVIKNKEIWNFDVDVYIGEIERLKEKYTEIEILSGIEFSEPQLFKNEFERYLKFPFDYIIGSIHHCKNEVFPGDKNLSEAQAICEYYELMISSIEYGGFQAVGHLDFPRRYFNKWDIPHELIDKVLISLIDKGITLEVNTSSIKEDSKEPMPKYSVVERYYDLGGRRIVIGSDAHSVSMFANEFDSVIIKLKEKFEIGYFKKKEFISCK